MAKDNSPLSVKVDPEDRALIEREAKVCDRTISSLIRSIVLPELRRREHQRKQQSDQFTPYPA